MSLKFARQFPQSPSMTTTSRDGSRIASHRTPETAHGGSTEAARPPRRALATLSISPPEESFDYEQITLATRRSAQTFSRTTLKVIQLLLAGDLSRLRSDTIADELRISPTTLRRRLRADNVCYQELLDCVRQYRCEKQLRQGWLPGKTLAWDLGYAEVNSFYRAFKRWTGFNYSDVKMQFV
jgi:AraC family mar-sox-rob regulon transcriptional activator